VCDESALTPHELIDDIPAAVHIAVPRGTRRPTISYLPTVVAPYAPTTFTLGVERFEAAPEETIPMDNAAHSVVDAMRHRSRIGETLAELGALSVIRPAVKAVLA
jgi:predicted transcriptional regulator of viral defense system